MMRDYGIAIDGLTRLRGIRGAMVVAATDGVAVAETLMEGVKGGALAALAATLATRVQTIAASAECGPPRLLQLLAAEGAILVAPAAEDLLLVAIAAPEVPLGLVRLEMLRLAERLA